MDKIVHYFVLSLILPFSFQLSQAQNCKLANFGIDQDVMEDTMYVGLANTGIDDWFSFDTTDQEFLDISLGLGLNSSYYLGNGLGVIDTSGARNLSRQYYSHSFARGMSQPPYSVQNGKLWLDAIFFRDTYDNSSSSSDSSIFVAGGSSQPKNGDDPGADWQGGIGSMQGKNDIIEVMSHARRNGPSLSDDLWLFNQVSLRTANGSRYLDLELFQTDFYYNANDGHFYNAGPDAGHTAWQFDPGGQVQQVGDMIAAFEFDNTGIVKFEIRLWVSSLDYALTNPVNFAWDTAFDASSSGAGFGYASIIPLNGYTMCSTINKQGKTRSGPFGTINSNASFDTNYDRYQAIEFGINLSQLGIDPQLYPGANPCAPMFRKLMFKSRASASFSSALKDFTPPIDFLNRTFSPQFSVQDLTCKDSIASLKASLNYGVYSWSTTNGNIISNPDSNIILANQVGKYFVSSRRFSVCPVEQTDTLDVIQNLTKPLAAAFGGNISYAKPTDTLLALPGGSSYLWSHLSGFSSTLQEPIVSDTGVYTVMVTDTLNGCRDTADAYVGWSFTILSAILNTFHGTYTDQGIDLHWSWAQNLEEGYWRLERSTDGFVFEQKADIEIHEGQANAQFMDMDPGDNPPSKYYYRLKLILPDGSLSQSQLIEVSLPVDDLYARAWLNAPEGHLHLRYRNTFAAEVWDNQGRLLYQKTMSPSEKWEEQIISTGNLVKGLYIITLKGPAYIQHTKIVLP